MTVNIDPKKVLYADLDANEGIVLNLTTKNYYRLNVTGQVIWQQLTAGKLPREVAAALTEKFDVTLEEALADVTDFVKQMETERLTQKPPGHPAHSMQAARQSKKDHS